ncbi:hypothetical protein NQZ68_019303 [Dissostichus eleginoides]|nr:hypothetical protein NQZ68_019303 [Dissostichus eleginoides]
MVGQNVTQSSLMHNWTQKFPFLDLAITSRLRAASSRPVLIPVRILLRHGPVPDIGLGEKRRRHNSSPLSSALAFSC